MAKYREIEAALRQRIESGAWPPGAPIPKEAELAREFDCTRPTVARAMIALVGEGLIERRRRAGSRVAPTRMRAAVMHVPRVRDEIEASGRVYGYRLILREMKPPPPAIWALFGSGDALHLRCVHRADGQPHQVEDRWINLAAAPAAAVESFAHTGPNDWLVATLPFTRAEHVLSAALADGAEARTLGIAERAPVFVILRTTWLGRNAVTRVRLVHPGAEFRLSTRDAG